MRLLALWIRMALGVTVLAVLCTIGIVAALLGFPKHKALRLVLPTWARLNLLICNLKIEVSGAEHLAVERPCIFVANHQGLLDAFVFPTILDAPMFYPVKKELVKVPFMGWLVWATDQPLIDREDHIQAMQAMDKTAQLLKQGLCTLVFPEGTRSRDGRLGEFKKGAFRISMDTGVPIVPVTLIDSADHMPMGTFDFKPGTIHVVVDPPIQTTGWNRKNMNANVELIREQFLRNITQWRVKLGLPAIAEGTVTEDTPDGGNPEANGPAAPPAN